MIIFLLFFFARSFTSLIHRRHQEDRHQRALDKRVSQKCDLSFEKEKQFQVQVNDDDDVPLFDDIEYTDIMESRRCMSAACG